MFTLLEKFEDEDDYIEWRDGMKEFYKELGFEYPKIVGDIMYPSAYDEYVMRGYDLRKMWKDFKEAD